MHSGSKRPIILVAEDDENDAFMLKRAFAKTGVPMPVYICQDGEATMNYLKGKGEFANREAFPFPRVLVTDLKMPLCSGFEVLAWLQSHPECNLIPKIVFSASNQEADVIRAYQLGANCYFTKPTSPEDLLKIVRLINDFWSVAEMPPLPETC